MKAMAAELLRTCQPEPQGALSSEECELESSLGIRDVPESEISQSPDVSDPACAAPLDIHQPSSAQSAPCDVPQTSFLTAQLTGH